MDPLIRRLQMQVMALEEDKAALLQQLKNLKHAWTMDTSFVKKCKNLSTGQPDEVPFMCSVCKEKLAVVPIYCPHCGRLVETGEE